LEEWEVAVSMEGVVGLVTLYLIAVAVAYRVPSLLALEKCKQQHRYHNEGIGVY
jgi:hypothetical protein